MSILSLLVALILIGLLFWGVRAIAAAFSIPPPIVTVIYVVLVILVVVWLLQSLGGLSGGPALRLQ
jgi:hypothetical protein